MTNTTSEFGRELDSLADIVSFGIAPAILAYVWGVHFVREPAGVHWLEQLEGVGKFVAFLFLVCGAARLARFNIQKNPVPKNPGAPNRKYFVGLPIPAAAGMVAAVVYRSDGYPVTVFYESAVWFGLIGLLSFMMVSTWRHWSFKELNLMSPRSPVLLVLMAAIVYSVWEWSKNVLLLFATSYVASGIIIRLAGLIRRYFKRSPSPSTEVQPG